MISRFAVLYIEYVDGLLSECPNKQSELVFVLWELVMDAFDIFDIF